jgi:hypothetical protein
MNTGVYGSHFENGALYMSLWRGVSYCAHPIPNRDIIPTDRFIKKVDMGECGYSFRLGLIDSSVIDRETQKFKEKPYAINVFPIGGSRRSNGGFKVSLSDDSVSVVTVKKADGRDAMIFRLHNNTSKARATTLSVDGAAIELSFGRYEVKTVLLENGVRETAVIHFPEGAAGKQKNGEFIYRTSCYIKAEDIVGSTGAGDAFAAGVIYALHQDWDLASAMELGAASSNFNLRSATATGGAVSLEKMQNFLKECGHTAIPAEFADGK